MRVNEIFYSLQGEGHFTGTAAVFVRLAGCNLSCPFCDTRHQRYTEMTEEAIVEAVRAFPATHVVITGGEPTLQLTSTLINRLHTAGKFVQIETNGTVAPPPGVDWVTCSPKEGRLAIDEVDELKLLYLNPGQDLSVYDHITARIRCLQPCDTGDPERNAALIAAVVDTIKTDPRWRLSLQTHKLIHIP